MEMLDIEWERCLDGYKLVDPVKLDSKEEKYFAARPWIDRSYWGSPMIARNSHRMERYHPLKNVLFAVFAAFIERARVTGNLFLDRPWGLVFPLIGLLAMCGVFAGVRRRRDAWPFALTAVFFVAAFLSLAVMFWPYVIPYTITVGNAAAPEKTLSFLFWGAGVFVLPVIAIYTGLVYWVFRGKLRKGYG
jgi:cytochrome bd-type quinol oxidase subunit 2